MRLRTDSLTEISAKQRTTMSINTWHTFSHPPDLSYLSTKTAQSIYAIGKEKRKEEKAEENETGEGAGITSRKIAKAKGRRGRGYSHVA